jgi:protein-disulfide isomerase-like protein with CxxC motif
MSERTWLESLKHDREIEETAGRHFQILFDWEKAKGYSDGEAARRVICTVNTEKDRTTKVFHKEKITCEAFADEMHTLNRIYDFAADVWNKSPESAAQGWRA